MKKSLKIAHLYPDLFNLYSDGGNLLTLKKRCEFYNIDYTIYEIKSKDEFIKNCDIYFIGTEQDLSSINIPKEIFNHKLDLQEAKNKGSIVLGLGGGYQLLGQYYKTLEGRCIDCFGLIDMYTIATEKRFSGNLTFKSDINNIEYFVGYENHISQTYLEKNTTPLGYVQIGQGNNGEDKTEGAISNNVFGTYLYGAFLPNNVQFLDYILSIASNENLKPLTESLEMLVHNSLISKTY